MLVRRKLDALGIRKAQQESRMAALGRAALEVGRLAMEA
jgi:hypothetical protein